MTFAPLNLHDLQRFIDDELDPARRSRCVGSADAGLVDRIGSKGWGSSFAKLDRRRGRCIGRGRGPDRGAIEGEGDPTSTRTGSLGARTIGVQPSSPGFAPFTAKVDVEVSRVSARAKAMVERNGGSVTVLQQARPEGALKPHKFPDGCARREDASVLRGRWTGKATAAPGGGRGGCLRNEADANANANAAGPLVVVLRALYDTIGRGVDDRANIYRTYYPTNTREKRSVSLVARDARGSSARSFGVPSRSPRFGKAST